MSMERIYTHTSNNISRDVSNDIMGWGWVMWGAWHVGQGMEGMEWNGGGGRGCGRGAGGSFRSTINEMFPALFRGDIVGPACSQHAELLPNVANAHLGAAAVHLVQQSAAELATS